VLRFRGHAVADLARVFSYERVAALLWQADADGHAWPVRPLRLPSMPPATTLGDHIRVALVLTAAADPHRHDLRPESVVVSARQLIATAAAAMPPSADTAPALVIDDEKVQGSIASLVAARLGAAKVSARLVRAVNTALVVLADHELATSTFAARVAASTRADIGSALLAGASANGPLHMTAGRDVMLLLRDAEARGPAAAVGDLLRSGRRMPGFGHTIYRVDPRFPLLFDVIERAGLPARRVELVRELLAFAGERVAVAPNVDAAIAALCYAAGARLDATEAIFLVARMAGWTAHALEEYDEPPLRFRTRGLYVGERPG
jgi:citrate synthase